MALDNYFKIRRSSISRSGDQIDTTLRLAFDPLEDDEAATKRYVDRGITPGPSIPPPLVVGRYYFGQWYSQIVAHTGVAGRAYGMVLYCGGPVTWDRIVATCNTNHVAIPRGNYEIGIMEIDDLGPPYGIDPWLWTSGILPFPSDPNNYIELPLSPVVQTITTFVCLVLWRSHPPVQSSWMLSSNSNSAFGVYDGAFSIRLGSDMLVSPGDNTIAGLTAWNPSQFINSGFGGLGRGPAPKLALRLASRP